MYFFNQVWSAVFDHFACYPVISWTFVVLQFVHGLLYFFYQYITLAVSKWWRDVFQLFVLDTTNKSLVNIFFHSYELYYARRWRRVQVPWCCHYDGSRRRSHAVRRRPSGPAVHWSTTDTELIPVASARSQCSPGSRETASIAAAGRLYSWLLSTSSSL